MSLPGAGSRAMPGDFERLPALVSPAAPGPGLVVLAGELFGRMRAELSVVGGLVGGGLLDLLTIAGLAAGLRERYAEPARPRP